MNDETPKKCEEELYREQLHRLSRGFSMTFWGALLSVMLLSGVISINPLKFLRLPSYIFGTILMYAGGLYLFRAGHLSTKWPSMTRLLVVLLGLEIYFSPFVYWWLRSPHVSYFTVHIGALALTVSFTLFLLTQLIYQFALRCGDTAFQAESLLCGWVVLVLMLLPVIGTCGYVLTISHLHSSTLYEELSQLFFSTPSWIQAIFLMPFTLTMAILWKAKERSLLLLRRHSA